MESGPVGTHVPDTTLFPVFTTPPDPVVARFGLLLPAADCHHEVGTECLKMNL
jgi:hypothetical protein